MKKVDFTNCEVLPKTYNGSNGGKRQIKFNNELYMIKTSSIANHNPLLSYSNSCISEYIGSKIFNSVGIQAQEVLLGTYFDFKKNKAKLVVACKDFAVNGKIFQDFASFKNQKFDSTSSSVNTELNEIIDTINTQDFYNSQEILDRFWDMFIIDAFIGNWDRHNGNWGFLYCPETKKLELAPVFDCGSSLFPQADENLMSDILTNPAFLNFRIKNIPLSAIKINGEKINYYDYILNSDNINVKNALKRIVPKIDLEMINDIIDDIIYISDLQKTFYKTMLKERKEQILDKALENVLNSEKSIDDKIKDKKQKYVNRNKNNKKTKKRDELEI